MSKKTKKFCAYTNAGYKTVTAKDREEAAQKLGVPIENVHRLPDFKNYFKHHQKNKRK